MNAEKWNKVPGPWRKTGISEKELRRNRLCEEDKKEDCMKARGCPGEYLRT